MERAGQVLHYRKQKLPACLHGCLIYSIESGAVRTNGFASHKIGARARMNQGKVTMRNFKMFHFWS